MSLRDKAARVVRALRRGSTRKTKEALGDVVDEVRVRVMDEVVTRLSGRPVTTNAANLKDAPAPAPVPFEPAAAPSPALPPDETVSRTEAARPTPAPSKGPHVVPAAGTGDLDPLPEGYGDNRLTLVARDPAWAFAYWDFDPAHVQDVARGLRDPRALLRFYEVGHATPIVDADVSPENGRYYLRVPRPGRTYEARLVLVDATGRVRELARSNDAAPPSQGPGADAAPRFVRMNAQVDVLDRLDEVLVPPPRLVVDLGASEVPDATPFGPRDTRWAGVLARVRADHIVPGLAAASGPGPDGVAAGGPSSAEGASAYRAGPGGPSSAVLGGPSGPGGPSSGALGGPSSGALGGPSSAALGGPSSAVPGDLLGLGGPSSAAMSSRPGATSPWLLAADRPVGANPSSDELVHPRGGNDSPSSSALGPYLRIHPL